YGDIEAWEFFDLKTDPQEMHNRIDDPAMQETIGDLKPRLVALRREYRDSDGPAVSAALGEQTAQARSDAMAAAGLHHH
ncbi:MAG TPA: sulfatase/phosphatase domain-containing protein, partial [Qipengyuania sp.]|nr:sulfatase/phosphatase domain-containing protein [Qipengyuania sp.]